MQTKTCPICHSEFVVSDGESYAPFCSRRCKDADLNRWFSEGYSVPVETERPLREAGIDLEGSE